MKDKKIITYKLEKNSSYMGVIKLDDQGLINLRWILSYLIKDFSKVDNLSFMAIRAKQFIDHINPQIEECLKQEPKPKQLEFNFDFNQDQPLLVELNN